MADKQENTKVHAATATTLRLIEEAQATWQEFGKVGDRFVVAASRATFAAHRDGIIGKGQKFESGTEFGKMFPNVDGTGASKSTVTRWRRCGAALSVGIDPESVEWRRLVSKANDPRLGSVLDSETVTKAKVEKALRKVFPRGKFAPATPAGSDIAPGEGNGNTSPASEREASIPNGVPGMLDILEKVAMRLENTAVTPAESARLASILARFETVTVAPEESVLTTRTA